MGQVKPRPVSTNTLQAIECLPIEVQLSEGARPDSMKTGKHPPNVCTRRRSSSWFADLSMDGVGCLPISRNTPNCAGPPYDRGRRPIAGAVCAFTIDQTQAARRGCNGTFHPECDGRAGTARRHVRTAPLFRRMANYAPQRAFQLAANRGMIYR